MAETRSGVELASEAAANQPKRHRQMAFWRPNKKAALKGGYKPSLFYFAPTLMVMLLPDKILIAGFSPPVTLTMTNIIVKKTIDFIISLLFRELRERLSGWEPLTFTG